MGQAVSVHDLSTKSLENDSITTQSSQYRNIIKKTNNKKQTTHNDNQRNIIMTNNIHVMHIDEEQKRDENSIDDSYDIEDSTHNDTDISKSHDFNEIRRIVNNPIESEYITSQTEQSNFDVKNNDNYDIDSLSDSNCNYDNYDIYTVYHEDSEYVLEKLRSILVSHQIYCNGSSDELLDQIEMLCNANQSYVCNNIQRKNAEITYEIGTLQHALQDLENQHDLLIHEYMTLRHENDNLVQKINYKFEDKNKLQHDTQIENEHDTYKCTDDTDKYNHMHEICRKQTLGQNIEFNSNFPRIYRIEIDGNWFNKKLRAIIEYNGQDIKRKMADFKWLYQMLMLNSSIDRIVPDYPSDIAEILWPEGYLKRRKKELKERTARRERIMAYRAKSTSKFQIRCRKPVEDEIFDVDEFVKYIKEHFKVDGKTGQVGAARLVNVQKSTTTVHVMSKKPFPKYYLKFLTKRYLKRHGLRDYVRVIADKKSSYELRYFNIQEDKK
eukprot:325737_1